MLSFLKHSEYIMIMSSFLFVEHFQKLEKKIFLIIERLIYVFY